jgi:hypothetical protein
MDSAVAPEPSEVLQQLNRAIEAANQNESESALWLERRITASRRLIDEINKLLLETGGSGNEPVERQRKIAM